MTENCLNNCVYLLSAEKAEHWPEDFGSEVAFAGRSNVGKSSAINRLTGHKSLARTSKTPGRTQQIIFFELNSQARLVEFARLWLCKSAFEDKKQVETTY